MIKMILSRNSEEPDTNIFHLQLNMRDGSENLCQLTIEEDNSYDPRQLAAIPQTVARGRSCPNPVERKQIRVETAIEDPSDDENQHKLQQKKLEDDELLKDADIPLDGIGKEELAQLLVVLRESRESAVSAGECKETSASRTLKDSVKNKEQDEETDVDEPIPESTPQQLVHTRSKHACDSSTSVILTKDVSTISSKKMKGRGGARQASEEDQKKAVKGRQRARKKKARQNNVSASEDVMMEEEDAAEDRVDSPEKMGRVTRNKQLRGQEMGETGQRNTTAINKRSDAEVSASDDIAVRKKAKVTNRTVQIEETTAACSSDEEVCLIMKNEIAEQEKARTKFEEEKSDDSDLMGKDLLSRSTKRLSEIQADRMKLSSRQKEQGQHRFKDLYRKMSQSLSSCQLGDNLTPLSQLEKEEALITTPSSQDLFNNDQSDEDSGPTRPGQVKTNSTLTYQSTESDRLEEVNSRSIIKNPRSSLHQSEFIHSRGKQEAEAQEYQGQGSDEDNLETQAPEDLVLKSEEEELMHVYREDNKNEVEENGRRSIVYSTLATQPGQPSSSQSHEVSSSQPLTHREISSQSVAEDANLSLVHENKFTWLPLPHCSLQRHYSCAQVSPCCPYFCPPAQTPAQYTSVIVNMLNEYFRAFTEVQRRSVKKLSWGNPVRTGRHMSSTLDAKKRFPQKEYRFDLEVDSDEEDSDNNKPELRRRHTDRDVGIVKKDTVNLATVRKQEHVANGKGNVADQLAYITKIQIDSDSELPDFDIGSFGSTGMSGVSQSENQKESDCKNSTLVTSGLVDCYSQSSDSLLDEQGNLYCTQLPHRKRKTGEHDVGSDSVSGPDRPKRVCMGQPAQVLVSEDDSNSAFEMKPLTRRRKQESPADIDTEVIFMGVNKSSIKTYQKRKVSLETQHQAMIHSAADNDRGNATTIHIVHPRPTKAPTPTNFPNDDKLRQKAQVRLKLVIECGDEDNMAAEALATSRQNTSTVTLPKKNSMSHTNDRQSLPVRTNSRRESPPHLQCLQESVVDTKESSESELSDDSTFLTLKKKTKREVRDFDKPEYSKHQQIMQEDDRSVVEGMIGRITSARRAPRSTTEEQMSATLTVACPLCNCMFSGEKIEQHASDCQGPADDDDEEEEIQQQQQQPSTSRHNAVYSTNQLKRRPLHRLNEREEKCALCSAKFRDANDLKQHFNSCLQQYEREQAVVPNATAQAPQTRTTASRLKDYKIPKLQAPHNVRTPLQAGDTEEEIEEDSDGDIDFVISKEDQQQEKEDLQEEQEMDNRTMEVDDTTSKPLDCKHSKRKRMTRTKDSN